MNMLELRIDPDIHGLFDGLYDEQTFQSLKEDIRKNGIHNEGVVVEKPEEFKGVIVCGEKRWEITNELGIKFPYRLAKFEDKDEMMEYAKNDNILRRNLEPFEIAIVEQRFIKFERKYARRRQLSQLSDVGDELPLDKCLSDGETETGRIRYKIAKKMGVSHETARKTLYILDKTPKNEVPEVAKRIRSKQSSINKEFKKIIEREIPQTRDLTPIPKGKYHTIVIDPPWEVKKIIREVRPKQIENLDYPTMTVEQIKQIPIKNHIMEDGCHVYLWVTHKYLPKAFEIFKTWGVKYECLLTWIKNVGFTPFSWMYSTEHVLFGRVGSLELLKKGKRLDFHGKVREHSRKPDEFYELVKEVSPEPRLEMFSREKREGFIQHGDETGKF